MTTHYHLLVRTHTENLGAGMHWLNSSWARRFNRRHGEVGHAHRGRYASTVIERDEHLLENGALSPAGIRFGPGRACIRSTGHGAAMQRLSGLAPRAIWLDPSDPPELFGAAKFAVARYREFVESPG